MGTRSEANQDGHLVECVDYVGVACGVVGLVSRFGILDLNVCGSMNDSPLFYGGFAGLLYFTSSV